MTSRRSFFQAIAKAAAIIALAPQLAFRIKPEVFVTEPHYIQNVTGIYAQLQECGKAADSGETLNLDEIFKVAYDLKKARGNQDTIEILVRDTEHGRAAVREFIKLGGKAVAS